MIVQHCFSEESAHVQLVNELGFQWCFIVVSSNLVILYQYCILHSSICSNAGLEGH